MSENLLSKIIAEQTEILLKNINSVVQSANLEAEFDGLNASRFIFHTLHSLDKWFVNPAEYKYDENSSGGVAENLSIISSYRQGFDAAPGVVISRENLEKYAVSVAQKIRIYLAKLSDKMLSEKLDGCEFTRLELILGQFRRRERNKLILCKRFTYIFIEVIQNAFFCQVFLKKLTRFQKSRFFLIFCLQTEVFQTVLIPDEGQSFLL